MPDLGTSGCVPGFSDGWMLASHDGWMNECQDVAMVGWTDGCGRWMRAIAGTLKSPIQWLLVLANLDPPGIHPNEAIYREVVLMNDNPDLLIYGYLKNLPVYQLVSQKPLRTHIQGLIGHDSGATWRKAWNETTTQNKHLISDPTINPSGFNFPQKTRKVLNWI